MFYVFRSRIEFGVEVARARIKFNFLCGDAFARVDTVARHEHNFAFARVNRRVHVELCIFGAAYESVALRRDVQLVVLG